MKPRQIVLTDAAVNDILEQAAWYHEKSGMKLARRWEQAVSSTCCAWQQVLLVARHALSKPSSWKV